MLKHLIFKLQIWKLSIRCEYLNKRCQASVEAFKQKLLFRMFSKFIHNPFLLHQPVGIRYLIVFYHLVLLDTRINIYPFAVSILYNWILYNQKLYPVTWISFLFPSIWWNHWTCTFVLCLPSFRWQMFTFLMQLMISYFNYNTTDQLSIVTFMVWPWALRLVVKCGFNVHKIFKKNFTFSECIFGCGDAIQRDIGKEIKKVLNMPTKRPNK